MREAEQLVANTYPVYEQRHGSDPKNPIQLYDCMAPALKEYVRVPLHFYPFTHAQDIEMRL